MTDSYFQSYLYDLWNNQTNMQKVTNVWWVYSSVHNLVFVRYGNKIYDLLPLRHPALAKKTKTKNRSSRFFSFTRYSKPVSAQGWKEKCDKLNPGLHAIAREPTLPRQSGKLAPLSTFSCSHLALSINCPPVLIASIASINGPDRYNVRNFRSQQGLR